MPRAVRFDRYGGIDVLEVVDVPAPVPGPGELLVEGQGRRHQPGRGEDPRGHVARALAVDVSVGPGQRPRRDRRAAGRRCRRVGGRRRGDRLHGQPRQSGRARRRRSRERHHAAGGRAVAGRGLAVRGRHDRIRRGSGRVGEFRATPWSWRARPAGSARSPCSLALLAGATVIGLAERAQSCLAAGSRRDPGELRRRRRAADRGWPPAAQSTRSSISPAATCSWRSTSACRPERVDTVVDFGAGEKYGVKTEGTAAAANAGVLAELATADRRGHGSTCRSPACIRSSRCARPFASSSRGTPAGRSCSSRDWDLDRQRPGPRSMSPLSNVTPIGSSTTRRGPCSTAPATAP